MAPPRCAEDDATATRDSALPREDHAQASGESLGWVASVTRSIEYNHWIGLALIADGESLKGQRLFAVSPLHSECVEVTVTSPHHVDPENTRVRA